MSEKQKIVNDVYHEKAGCGSRQRTLDEARKKDQSITMDDINEFFKKNVEQEQKRIPHKPKQPKLAHFGELHHLRID